MASRSTAAAATGLLLDRLGPVGLEVSAERHALSHPGRDDYRMSVLGSITFGPDDAPAREPRCRRRDAFRGLFYFIAVPQTFK